MSEPKGKLSIESLLKGLFSKDESGNVFVRTTTTTHSAAADLLSPAVTSKSNETAEQLLRKAVVIAPDGNLAINLSIITA